jgi:dihydrofolate reductase
MGKVFVSTVITLDGVTDQMDQWMETDQGSSLWQVWIEQLQEADAMLLGRKNYEGFAAVWPELTDDIGYAEKVNAMPKYVASRTLDGPLEWNATLIEGDLSAAVCELKHDLVLHMSGCGEFTHELIKLGLVDELHFWVHPVMWGEGERPFEQQEKPELELTHSRAFDNGVMQLVYRPQARD